MMLWFALLLLLFRAPGSESRLLPEDQLRMAKGLCEEESVSDSLISSAAATFFVSRSLLSGSDQVLGHVNDLNVGKAQESRVAVSEKELLTELASIQAPSGGNHLVVENHPSYSLRNGNSLVVQQAEEKNRVPPAHESQNELFTKLASSSNSAPSEGDHRLVVEKKNRAPPAHESSESELLSDLQASSNSAPSGGDHHLTVEKKNRAPPSFQFESLVSVPSGGSHLVVEKRNRSPPSSKYESLISVPSGGDHLVVEKSSRSPPSSKYESLISVPSGGDHLVVEKSSRSPPSFMHMSESEVSNNLGKRSRPSTPSAPSGGDHLVVVEKKSHRSPPAEFQTLVSEPSGKNHMTAPREVSKKTRSPPAAGVDHSESEHVTVDIEGLKNREMLMNLAGTPSPGKHLVAEGVGKLASVPSDPSHLVVQNVERKTPPSAGSAADSESGQDELRSVTRQRSPPADDHDQNTTGLTDSESSVDTSQKVGCSDSPIWDSFENMAQQFANSVRRISVYSLDSRT